MEKSVDEDATSSEIRTIIIATDVVESCVTIPECAVVIDLCVHRRMRWSVAAGENQLTTEFITSDEALQRKGRTGRTCPGIVYRLIPQTAYRRL